MELFMADETRVDVDTRALTVEGLSSLHVLRMDGVIHLAEPALGMDAGHWRVGAWQVPYYMAPAHTRDLRPISDAEAAAYAADGYTIHEARRSPDWECPFALELRGMRLDALRAALAELTDMPGDALVVITSAAHPWEGRHSPAEPRLSTGRYMPNPSGGDFGDMYDDRFADRDDEDVPEAAVPAVFLSPSN
jgi:hypothetical protein